MWLKRIFMLLPLFVSVFWSEFVCGQENPKKLDSTKIYESIKSISNQRKSTTFLYSLIFKPDPVIPQKRKAKNKAGTHPKPKPYSAFEGKIIRKISIETIDPFGYSISDTAVKPHNFLSKSGNNVHIKSQNLSIRNLLLIRQNQIFDSLLVKESERLLRSRAYIQDVSFNVSAIPKSADSVDIFIRAIDKWSLTPAISASSSRFAMSIEDNNFSGLGHDFKTGGEWFHASDAFAYQMNYDIPNILNTYIRTNLNFIKDEQGNFSRNVTIDRPFFSPFAKWAAGISISNEFRRDSTLKLDSTYSQLKFKYNTQDYWVGRAIQIFKGSSEFDRTTNFIMAARYLQIHYSERPDEPYNPQYKYSDESFLLGSIGISTRKYFQDKYIFKFGLTEDVPVGRVLSLTGGLQEKNGIIRPYLGARVSSGKYYSWGYLSSNVEYGTFLNNKIAQQGAVIIGVNYYTNLIEVGKWKFRQFVKPQITIGINRFSNDSINLDEGYGLDGFKSNLLSGSSRLLFTLQTQSYAPWNVIGFRFGPYINCSLGMLGNQATGFQNSRLYSHIGIGVLIKNEKLIINTFQLSLSFYPLVPADGQNIFKFNSIRSKDFGFSDFEIGKPGVVVFQ